MKTTNQLLKTEKLVSSMTKQNKKAREKIWRLSSLDIPKVDNPEIVSPDFKRIRKCDYELGEIKSVTIKKSDDEKEVIVDIQYVPR